jgi:hypothetical protein
MRDVRPRSQLRHRDDPVAQWMLKIRVGMERADAVQRSGCEAVDAKLVCYLACLTAVCNGAREASLIGSTEAARAPADTER